MSDTPRTDAFVAGRDPIRLPNYENMADCIATGKAVRLLMIDYAEHARQLERELAAALADAQRLRASERRLKAMIPLFEEARDALTAIPLASAKLRGVRLDLADRMDDVGVPSRWQVIDAAMREDKP
jgi:hypothetical protein